MLFPLPPFPQTEIFIHVSLPPIDRGASSQYALDRPLDTRLDINPSLGMQLVVNAPQDGSSFASSSATHPIPISSNLAQVGMPVSTSQPIIW